MKAASVSGNRTKTENHQMNIITDVSRQDTVDTVLHGFQSICVPKLTSDTTLICTQMNRLVKLIDGGGSTSVAVSRTFELEKKKEMMATELGGKGILQFINDILRTFVREEALIKLGCRVVELLCLATPNVFLFGEFGLCQWVVRALHIYRTSPETCQSLCSVIVNIAYRCPANRLKLREAGACEAVVDVLKDFGGTHIDVGATACMAIYNMILKDEASKNVCKYAGATDVIHEVVKLQQAAQQHDEIGGSVGVAIVMKSNYEQLYRNAQLALEKLA